MTKPSNRRSNPPAGSIERIPAAAHTRDLWYKNAIIYSLSLEAFLDGDGDGIGDFGGAIRRLDYIQGLGATAVWLSPFHPSPRRDHGYDVADYYGVDPRFGSLGDFVEFSRACRQRGLRLLMDLVLNHCSDQHPWFQAAVEAPPNRFRDYFIWSDRKPKTAHEGVVFPGVQTSTWTYHRRARAWYFHRFYKHQPELNLANPEVQAELFKIVGFWLELGVSGFRVDAVPFLIAQEGINVDNPQPAFELLRDLRAFAQWRRGDAVFLAEANVPPELAKSYVGEAGERLQMIFNFPVNQALFYALATADARPLRKALQASQGMPPHAQWANFLRNHDELDLGRLTQAQRRQVFEAFGPEPEMQLYGRGIRRRLASMLGGDRGRLELANSLLLTLPGAPVLRYGDEIGMGDDLTLSERMAVRTPMQWSEEKNGGFTRAERPWCPPISDGPYGFQHVNVARQRTDPGSLLNWTERALRLRKELPEIGWGQFHVLDSSQQVLALRYEWDGRVSLYVHNFSDALITCDLNLGPELNEHELLCLQTDEWARTDPHGRLNVILQPYGYRWFSYGGLDDLAHSTRLNRSDQPTRDAP
jgi:maltose alpha-D-glucosyltransferase/alpha-amylase